MGSRYNSPPNWPAPPTTEWVPPQGWKPDPSWEPAPQGWDFWTLDPPVAKAATGWSRTGAWLSHHPFRVAPLNIMLWAVLALLTLLTGVGAVVGPSPSKPVDVANLTPPASTIAVPNTPSALQPSPPVSPQETPAAPIAPVTAIPPPPPVTDPIPVSTAGALLPNSARTPGAINASVTQATIGQTICVVGWTASVRPSSSVTTRLKVAQLASGYTYKGDTTTGDYEEDHLISLELGGAPSEEANLWPEPYNAPEGARVKDVVENKLHALVCGGTITLATAQRAIASNWWIAYQTYVGTAPTAPVYQPPPAAQPLPQPAPAPAPAPQPAPVAPGSGATALCNDGTYSYAAHHQGACSRHGGVSVFYK